MESAESLRSLHDDCTAAQKRFSDAVARRFTPGTRVHVQTHRSSDTYFTPATVINRGEGCDRCTSGDRVYIESVHGKRYWIHVYRLEEFDGER